MKYQTNGLGSLLFAALVISAHKEENSEVSYNDGGGKEFNITTQTVAFGSPLLCRKILSFYFVIDCYVWTTSVSAGLHQLLSENIQFLVQQRGRSSSLFPEPPPPSPYSSSHCWWDSILSTVNDVADAPSRTPLLAINASSKTYNVKFVFDTCLQ